MHNNAQVSLRISAFWTVFTGRSIDSKSSNAFSVKTGQTPRERDGWYKFLLSAHVCVMLNLVILASKGWMDGSLVIYVRFNSITVISGRWAYDNIRLCAMEPRLRSKRFPPHAGLEPETARSVHNRLTQLSHPGAPVSNGGISENNSFYCRTCFSKVRYRRSVFCPSVCSSVSPSVNANIS